MVIGLPALPMGLEALARQRPDRQAALQVSALPDTAQTLRSLREALQRDPRPDAVRQFAILLAAWVTDQQRDLGYRLEAEQYLRRITRSDPDDAEALTALGILLIKQRLRNDGERVLNRAMSAAERRGGELPPKLRAAMFSTLARLYESWWEDWQHLVWIPPTAQGALRCSGVHEAGLRLHDLAPLCPENFADMLERVVALDSLKANVRARMLSYYREALRADSTRAQDAVALLGHLADEQDWDEYMRLASDMQRRFPTAPRISLFAAIGLLETQRMEDASGAFDTALESMSPEDRAAFTNVADLLPPALRGQYADLTPAGKAETARQLFVALDPTYLTDVEERRLEHYARTAWADLKFGSGNGRRGWNSDRGEIWVRYGRPWRQLQCCYGDSATRFTYWLYGPRGPVFVFGRNLTYRHAGLTETARAVATEIGQRVPTTYATPMIGPRPAMPVQAVRFWSTDDSLPELALYAAPPWDSLDAAPGDSVETGIFLFDENYRSMVRGRRVTVLKTTTAGLSFGSRVRPGLVRFAVEARRADASLRPTALAQVRDSIKTLSPDGGWFLSDLLIADSIRPRVSEPRTWNDWKIYAHHGAISAEASPSVTIYFEIYPGPTGPAAVEYSVAVSVESIDRPGVVANILGQIAGSRGTEPVTTLRWHRSRATSGTLPEWVALDLQGVASGQYRLVVEVSDLRSGTPMRAERRLLVADR